MFHHPREINQNLFFKQNCPLFVNQVLEKQTKDCLSVNFFATKLRDLTFWKCKFLLFRYLTYFGEKEKNQLVLEKIRQFFKLSKCQKSEIKLWRAFYAIDFPDSYSCICDVFSSIDCSAIHDDYKLFFLQKLALKQYKTETLLLIQIFNLKPDLLMMNKLTDIYLNFELLELAYLHLLRFRELKQSELGPNF